MDIENNYEFTFAGGDYNSYFFATDSKIIYEIKFRDTAYIFDGYLIYIPYIMIVLMCLLMVAEIRLIALKFKNHQIKDNLYRYILIVSSIVVIILSGWIALPIIILWYVVLSVVEYTFSDSTK